MQHPWVQGPAHQKSRILRYDFFGGDAGTCTPVYHRAHTTFYILILQLIVVGVRTQTR